ncbi:MAG: hypothetical protein PF961_11970, partial [Planctomycetota bacterium]|nr:hypothetical protein [Planctomycetota bacterium]
MRATLYLAQALLASLVFIVLPNSLYACEVVEPAEGYQFMGEVTPGLCLYDEACPSCGNGGTVYTLVIADQVLEEPIVSAHIDCFESDEKWEEEYWWLITVPGFQYDAWVQYNYDSWGYVTRGGQCGHGSPETKGGAESAANGKSCPDKDCPPTDAVGDFNSSGQDPYGLVQQVASTINNAQLSHVHEASDFQFQLPAGCAPCGSGGIAGTSLPQLSLQRRHRYLDVDHQGSFGPGVFAGFDVRLHFYDDGGSQVIEIWDPRGQFAIYCKPTNAALGVYGDTATELIRDLRLYADSELTQPAATQAAAARAVITGHDGSTWTFEIIDPSPAEGAAGASSYRAGRLASAADPSGSQMFFTYAKQVSDDLDGDPQQLWRLASVTDALESVFTINTVRAGGFWVISAVDLPSGGQIDYSYTDVSLIGLTGVTYPDGNTSAFWLGEDLETGRVALHYDDAGAATTHRRKTAYLSPAATETSPGTWSANVPNRIRAVDDAEGERIYENWVTQSPGIIEFDAQGQNPVLVPHERPSVEVYVHSTSGDLMRFVVEEDTGFPVRTERSLTPYQPGTNWYYYDWEVVSEYQLDDIARINATTKSTGAVTSYVRHPVHGAVLDSQVTADADVLGSQHQRFTDPAAEAYALPTVQVDRAGRAVTHTYDPARPWLRRTTTRGLRWDPNTETAEPTGDEATWAWTYNTRGQLETETDANGNTTVYFYTANGLLETKVEPADEAGGTPPETHFSYYAGTSLVESITDPEGRVTRFDYDSRGRLIDTEYGDGSHERREYGTGVDANLLVATIDRRGVRTRLRYDR